MSYAYDKIRERNERREPSMKLELDKAIALRKELSALGRDALTCAKELKRMESNSDSVQALRSILGVIEIAIRDGDPDVLQWIQQRCKGELDKIEGGNL